MSSRLRGPANVVVTLAVALALTSCGGSEETIPPRSRASTLVWGFSVQPDQLNPLVYTSAPSAELIDLLFLKLNDWGPPPELAYEPVLATSWEISEDRRTITYELRRDVVWEDGTPTTARDVKFTWEMMAHPSVPFAAKGTIRPIESCEVVDDWTVRFRFAEPASEPLYATQFHVVPEHLLSSVAPEDMMTAAFNRSPVGNGRWKFVEWVSEDRVVLAASETSALGRPGFDRLIVRVIPEDNTLRTELLTGGVDVYHRFPNRFYREDSKHPKLEFLTFSDRTYTYVAWNNRHPVFADRRVREALTYAIDRQTIVDAFRDGFGTVVSVPLYKEHPAFNSELRPRPFDPARSAELLDEAGWTDRDADGIRMKDGRRLEFTYTLISGNEISEEIATMTQAEFGKLGVAVNAQFYEWTVYLGRVEKKNFDATVLATRGDFVYDPEDSFHSRAIDGRHNSTAFSHPEADSLIDLAKTIPDREERAAVWRSLQEVMRRELPLTVLYVGDALYPVRRDKVENPVMDVRGAFYRVHEWRPRRAAS